MGIVRNFIDIVGLISLEELLEKFQGQLVKTSEVESIFIGNRVSNIKNIYQVVVGMDVKSYRTIESNSEKIVVIDFIKKIKIVYYDDKNIANVLELTLPYNTFIEIDKDKEIYNIKPYIVDAYFELINKETLYSYFLFYINILDSKVHYNFTIEECVMKNESEECSFDIEKIGVSKDDLCIIDERNTLSQCKYIDNEEEYL